MSLYVSRKRRTDINVIPLIDVMTVLLVFILVTTRFDEMESLGITPPKAESAAKAGDPEVAPVVIAVDKSGAFFLDAKPVSRDSLAGALAARAKKEKRATALVVADESAPTGDTVFALDRARLAGLPSHLVTQKPHP